MATATKKVQNRKATDEKKQALKALRTSPKLERTTFSTSREMDFFGEKELVTQTGHERGEWPLVPIKELTDNGLDACESADIAPEITIRADATGISVRDNGPGLPEKTLAGALDFTVRASSKTGYVSPCRGAQGNALMTLASMPWVLDPQAGKFIVTAHDKRHVITCGNDPISQRTVVNDCVAPMKTAGTEIRLEWAPITDGTPRQPCSVWPFDVERPAASYRQQLMHLAEGFALFNPHATIRFDWFGDMIKWQATNPSWEKWRPNRPTSAHWYEVRHLRRLIGAYITHDRAGGTDRLVSDFLAEFDCLSRAPSQKPVLHEAGLLRSHLSELVQGGQFDDKRIEKLLVAMKAHTKPVKSVRLGVIGEEHLRARLIQMGVRPESFRYARKLADPKSTKPAGDQAKKASFIPAVLETAFGYLGDGAKAQRRIFSGANWSAAIKNPFRSFGTTGEGLETTLADLKATREEPIVFAIHLAHPRIEYTDAGKSTLIIGGGE